MAEKPIFARIHFSRAPVCTLLISGGKAVCRSYKIIHLVEGRSASDLDSKTDNSKEPKNIPPKKQCTIRQGAQLRQHIDATLGSGNLREAVRLPPGEDFNEWLAVNSAPFPSNFNDVVKTISKHFFRVHAHLYHSHFQKIVNLKEEAHLNPCFKHYILFTCVTRFFYFHEDMVSDFSLLSNNEYCAF